VLGVRLGRGRPALSTGSGYTVPESVVRRGVRLVWQSLRLHPWAHAAAIMGANVFALAVVGFTVVIGRITDEVIIPGLDGDGVSRDSVGGAVLVVVLVGVVRTASIMVRRWFNMLATVKTQRTWRWAVTDRFLDVPLAYYRSRPAGQLLAHADADVEVATSMLKPLAFSLSVVVLALAALISLLLVHPLFALVAVVMFPTLTFLNRQFTRKVEVPAAAGQEAVGTLSGIAHESFDGVLVVKTLGHESVELERFSSSARALREHRLAVGRLRAKYGPVNYALPQLGIIVLLMVGVWLVDSGSVSIGDVVRAMSLFSILTLPMEILGYLFQEMPRSVVAMDRINGVMAEPIEPRPVAPLISNPRSASEVEVEFDAVGFTHPAGLAVLNGLNLSLEPGESVALVGATGSGKSTAVALLAGLVPPTVGEVRIGGVPTTVLGPGGVAASVATVLQETFLFADTVRANLTLGRDVSDEELVGALTAASADGFVTGLENGLETVIGERGVTLSGGQRQRLAIARALLRCPAVLVLDDATSAVDPLIEEGILAALRLPTFAAGDRMTLLVVAHRLATIRLADRVLFLDDGCIAAFGTHEELLDVEGYATLARAYEMAGSQLRGDRN
jgi:ATP-binding cassette subfamily B protein